MVAIKPPQANKFLASPPKAAQAYLLFGSDAGLVLERAQKLSHKLAALETPPSEILRLDDTDLENDPERLIIELQTIAMFSSRKIVRAATGRRINAQSLRPLVEAASLEGYLIVEAGNLKPDESLRQLFEKSPSAAAIGCYPDDTADLSGLVDETLGAAGLSIDLEARQLLLSRLGADRSLSRGELDKLVLYAADQTTISIEDIEDITGDAAELALDRIPEAAANGDAATAILHLGRSLNAGENAQGVIAVIQRYFLRLHKLRSDIDKGRSVDDAVRSLRPPPHFKQRDLLVQQCRAWQSRELSAALLRCADAAKSARLNTALEEALTERLILALVQMARTKTAAQTTKQ